jgi:hypothetical protein
MPNTIIKSSTTTTTSTTDTTAKPNSAQPSLRYVTFEGPLNGSLPLFDASIAQGYNGDIQSFQVDLINVARYYVNALIQKNLLTYFQQQQLQEQQQAQNTDVLLLGSSSGSASSSGASIGGPSTMGGNVNVNSFGTNNQEANVDEGDVVKSDGITGTITTIWTAHTC